MDYRMTGKAKKKPMSDDRMPELMKTLPLPRPGMATQPRSPKMK